MTRIKQDTEKVHLVGEDGRALCEHKYPEHVVEVASWLAGFTPASVGSRLCRDCEATAGTGAKLAEAERPSGAWHPLDSTGSDQS